VQDQDRTITEDEGVEEVGSGGKSEGLVMNAVILFPDNLWTRAGKNQEKGGCYENN